MSVGRVYVLGGGLAGLAAASMLCERGRAVTLIETASQAGGRCRSFFDKILGCDIDNGNHLVLSGNTDAMMYLNRIGAAHTIDILPPRFPFHDVISGASWEIRMGRGRIPWRLLCPHHGIPGARLRDYWRSRKLLKAGPAETIAEVLSGTGELYEQFWKPFAVAVLNTEPENAAACLLAPVIRETLMQGGQACRPVLAKQGLGYSFVDPALAYLQSNGVDIRLGVRCRGIGIKEGRVVCLDVQGDTIYLGDDDVVISALPAGVVGEMLPSITVPDEFRAIVNVHFDMGQPAPEPRIIGLLGGLAEWLFVRGRIASVTISAAEHVVEKSADDIATRVWQDIAPLLARSPDSMPLVRVIKEKRATFAQTPRQTGLRPPAVSDVRNLLMAGDWTDTGLPATIEGAIRSGHRCAGLALNT
ncbi:MAG: hydroxysqualene dehydroxylase HpnE [Rhodospirillales bacterium]